MAKTPALEKARKMFEDMVESITGPEPEDLRRAYDDLCDRFPVPEDVEVEEVEADGVPSLLVGAPGASQERIVVFLHGGGFMIGRARGYRGLAYGISKAADARVLVPDYRLAPESKFPAALDDAVSAARWAMERVGASSVVVAGDSAGGGLTMSTLVSLKQGGGPLPAGAVCLSPWVDLTNSGESHERNKELDPVVSEEMVTGMSAAYLQGVDPGNPLASPLFADLSGLPPVLVFVGTAEILEDDARSLARRIEEAGGEVELVVVDDMLHIYPVFHDFLPEAAEAVAQVGEFVMARTSEKVS